MDKGEVGKEEVEEGALFCAPTRLILYWREGLLSSVEGWKRARKEKG